MKEQLEQVFTNLDSRWVMYSVFVSIILGVVIFLVGIIFKNKQKNWWIYLAILGAFCVIANVIKLISIIT